MTDANFSQIHASVNGPSALKNAVDSLVNLNAASGVADIAINAGVSSTGISSFLVSLAQNGVMFVDASAADTACVLTMGADSAANATTLLEHLDMADSGPASRILKFERSTGAVNGAVALNLGNTSSSNTYVQMALAGVLNSSGSVVIMDASALSPAAYVRASKLTDTSILFDVVKRAVA
jgi:hypothetical protein